MYKLFISVLLSDPINSGTKLFGFYERVAVLYVEAYPCLFMTPSPIGHFRAKSRKDPAHFWSLTEYK